MKNTVRFLLISILMTGTSVTANAARNTNYFVREKASGDVEILPYAAMCTVHAYNIGETVNAATNREEMNKVVALKSQMITREMKKQYDYLDATVKRFEIQLQKAILVAQAEAAGATPASQSGGSAGATLSGADNCSGKNRVDTVYCLRNNYSKLRAANESNKRDSAFKKQIESDKMAINSMPKGENFTAIENNLNTLCESSGLNTKSGADKCLSAINGAIIAIDEYKPTTSNQQRDAYGTAQKPGG